MTGGASRLVATVAPPNIWHHLGATSVAFTPTVLIAGAIALYLWGVVRVGRLHPQAPWSTRRTAAFLGAMATTFIAIESVIGVYDDVLFADHMVQHLLLIMVAAPLVAMAAPVELVSQATAGSAHRTVRPLLDSKVAEVVGHPLFAFILYAVFIPAAHLTSLYQYALTNDLAHDQEHLAFLVIGYLFWRPVVAIEPSRHPLNPGLRLLFTMIAVPVDTFCGLALVSTTHEMFPYYNTLQRTWGPSRVGDLHAGGVFMWIGGDGLMILAMIPVVVVWVRSEAERTRIIDAELDAQEAADGSETSRLL